MQTQPKLILSLKSFLSSTLAGVMIFNLSSCALPRGNQELVESPVHHQNASQVVEVDSVEEIPPIANSAPVATQSAKKAERQVSQSNVLRLTEAGAVEMARKTNPDILNIKNQLGVGKGRKRQALSKLLPHLVVEGEYGSDPDRRTFGELTDTDLDNQRRADVYVRQHLFDGGTRVANYREAAFREKALREQAKVVGEKVIARMRNSYARALAAATVEAVAKEHVRKSMATGSVLKKRQEQAGTMSIQDLSRSNYDLSVSKGELTRATRDFRIAKLDLLIAIGFDPSSYDDVILEDGPAPKVKLLSKRQAISTAMANRYELQAMHYLVAAQSSRVRAVGGEYLPDVSVIAGYSYEDSSSVDSEDGYHFAVRGRWDIFDGFGREGRLLEERSKKREMELNLMKTKNMVSRDVEVAYSRIDAATSLVQTAAQAEQFARKAYGFAQIGFKNGDDSMEKLLRSGEHLYTSQLDLTEALLERRKAVVALDRAMGRLGNSFVRL